MSSQGATHDDDEGVPPLHEEHGEHGEPWLVSYADMMTLLFGFFVVMYSFAQAKLEKMPDDIDKLVHMRAEIAKHFGGEYVTPLADVKEQFKQAMGGEQVDKDIKIEMTPEGMDLTLASKILFDSGSAEIQPKAKDALRLLADLIVKKTEEYSVVVEGHTDDAPIIQNKSVYPSNWELSGARASAVLRLFEEAKFDPTKLTAVGFGSARPQLPNRDKSGKPIAGNMAVNRRIKIKMALFSKPNEDQKTFLQKYFIKEAQEARKAAEKEAPKEPAKETSHHE